MTRSGKTKKKDEEEEEEDEMTQKEIGKLLIELKRSIDFMSSKFDALEKDNKEIKKTLKKLEKENSELKQRIQTIEQSTINKEKETIKSNLIISGIDTRENNENPIQIVNKVLQGMSIQISADAIKNAYIKDNKTETNTQIVVVLKDENDKIEILKTRKTIGSIRTNECNLKGPNREIYINEQLTNYTANLFYLARQLKKDKIVKYVWTRNGNVYVRKTESSTKQKISNTDDLNIE